MSTVQVPVESHRLRSLPGTSAHTPPLALPRSHQRHWDSSLPMEFQRGDYFFLPGDPARSVFLIRGGTVRLGRLLDSGGELTLDLAGPGEIVGEEAMFGVAHRVGLAQALSNVTAVPLPVPMLARSLERDAALALAFTRIVWERGRRLESRAVEGTFTDCRRRLCRVLLDIADRFGIDEPEGRRIGVRLTHEDLARLIGAARETVTPLLVQLRREGTIDYDRTRIVIRNGGRLAS
jgi:CRP/FNR family transcriptional regulator, cyclic AMP receptor protein